ncbi:MAG TPA: bifunctional 4-hydroxy-2-oxoglutarate aldolase/2-dehydro-3-deoxy-phosphogluconate aldolase [Solirubrobacteraceae bacterium]|jgi:2-dehydro-3-deoxyphosphogluconate aldolase/(4S)-4-hydroxy-2-oxoglutarate aldolase|nr:bifunctional 4-hydroxy-2-oxoglutarate aldolase/2-dehydro-3-deoxy-phosphogluconate aldolase [Solirubrobacteraceae bacterium]
MTGDGMVRPASPLRPEDPPVFAILRRRAPEVAAQIAVAIARAGIPALELTIDSPGVLDLVRALRAQLPDTAIGVGTVLDPADVDAAIAAGAQFVVSPNVDREVIAACTAAGIPALPGAATPTEALQAWRAGASLVKLFPASAGGPATLRAIREPLPMIPLVAVGGVDGANARAYLDAGASAVGIGSWLTGAGSADEAAGRAAQLLAELRA